MPGKKPPAKKKRGPKPLTDSVRQLRRTLKPSTRKVGAEKTKAFTEPANTPRRKPISAAAKREPPKLRLIRTAAAEGFVRDALEYAGKIAGAKLPGGEYARVACQRFLDDYQAAKRDGRWEFRGDLAHKAMELVGRLPNVKGPLAGKSIELMDWQKLVYANVFGFVERGTTTRRFRQAVVFVPKGNGKTTISAPAALHCTFNENEGGAEGYAAAVTRDQARILFEMARQMVLRSQFMQNTLGCGVYRDSIVQNYTASSLVPISSDAKALDGLNVAVGVCDEIGSHKTAEVYDALISAMGKRLQPLLMSISTATGNASGIGKQLWDYLIRVLAGVQDDDRLFGIIYSIDATDDPWDEASWIKANPGWNHTVQPDAIRAIMRQARNNPAQEAIARTRHLNIWIGADEQLFSTRAFAACADPTLRLEHFAGRPCHMGLDMASRTDLAALALVFPDGAGNYAVFVRCYINAQAVLDARNPSYPGWAAGDYLTITQGNETDFATIEQDVLDLCGRFHVESCAFDPWCAVQLAQRLTAKGVPMQEFRKTVQMFSEPTKELDAAIRSGRLRHDGNPVLAWCIGNCVGHYDSNDNVKPNKSRPEAKIDAADAVIMALARCVRIVDSTSVYETRGLFTLG